MDHTGNDNTDASTSGTNADQASVLVKALRDFVLPLVHATRASGLNSAAPNTNDIKYPTLGPEARQLVTALEIFVGSLLNPPPDQQAEGENRKGGEVPEEGEPASVQPAVVGDPFSPPVFEAQGQRSFILVCQKTCIQGPLVNAAAPEKPRMLRLALDKARSRAFNKMPIRLLTFNSDGSGIRLLDRSAIWDRVSTLMETDFNGDQKNSELVALHARYAILSHTWLHDKPGEVTYTDWQSGTFDTNSPGYQKLSNFCRVAATEHGITLAWMDTICINKESSSELDESIRSMYKWYHDAHICITYLAQTTTIQHMRDDSWFTRGWTLQELIAPVSSKFYGAHWQKLIPDMGNDMQDILVREEIQAATTITARELSLLEIENMFDSFSLTDEKDIPISRRMQWSANRHVTREEDIAYSLMGIFRVSMTIAYGEGSERAFFRLIQQILNSSLKGVQDVINWGGGPDLAYSGQSSHSVSSLIPSNPKQYLWRADKAIHWPSPTIPATITHLGLHLSVLIMPAISRNPFLQNAEFNPIGDYYATVNIGRGRYTRIIDENEPPTLIELPFQPYNVLERGNSVLSGNMKTNDNPRRDQIILGVLNFIATEASVFFPSRPCFAVCLNYSGSSFSEAVVLRNVDKADHTDGITFDLQCRVCKSSRGIPKTELAKHGMQLRTMYL